MPSQTCGGIVAIVCAAVIGGNPVVGMLITSNPHTCRFAGLWRSTLLPPGSHQILIFLSNPRARAALSRLQRLTCYPVHIRLITSLTDNPVRPATARPGNQGTWYPGSSASSPKMKHAASRMAASNKGSRDNHRPVFFHSTGSSHPSAATLADAPGSPAVFGAD
jgi:hypothetical protein